MCGPLALALPGGAQRAQFLFGRLLYNAGRVCTYATLGFGCGLIGKTLALAGLQRWLSIFAGLVLVGWYVRSRRPGLFRALDGVVPRVLAPLKTAIVKQLRERALPALFIVGLLNGLLPCGLVYLALAAATATGTARDGAFSMIVFGAGTIPAMLAVSLCGRTLQMGIRMRFQRAVPALVLMIAMLFLLRGLSLGIPYLSPDLGAIAASGGDGCCR